MIQTTMKKVLLTLAAILIFTAISIGIAVVFLPHKVVPVLLGRQVQKMMGSEDIFSDRDRIVIYTVGTASPLPGKRAQTGTAVIVNNHFFMFDVGDGVVQKAETLRLPLDRLDGIFITHWHSDHFIDLPYLINRSWVLGRNTDLHLYGPEGLDTLTHAIGQFLHLENQYRVDHHGREIMDIGKALAIPHEFQLEKETGKIVFDQDGITITAFKVDHDPIDPAVGYALEYNGKKLVISGDTKKNGLVQEMAQNADILIHEVMLTSLLQQVSADLEEQGLHRNAKITADVQNYHTSPSEVAQLAADANVSLLVLHHFAPAPDFAVVRNLYRREMRAYKGKIRFANDGDRFIVK